MKLLDLFCGAGGAGAGYAAAGFEVTGVDIKKQKRYPFEFIEADALTLTDKFLEQFDVIHCSPPCQGYTALRHAPGTRGAPKMIPWMRAILRASGKPYIIENVEAARPYMLNPTMLCGTMFGLGYDGFELHRHRLFETSFPLLEPACRHSGCPVIGVYGGHARNRSSSYGGRKTKDTWFGGHKEAASIALGIDWMTLTELSEAIPPAYTKWVGERLMEKLYVENGIQFPPRVRATY